MVKQNFHFKSPVTNIYQMKMISLLTLLTCSAAAYAVQTSSTFCTVSPDVTYHGLHVDCRNKGLTEIPRDFPANTTSIDLSNNQIVAVRNYSFSSVNKLQFLNLEHNGISQIEHHAFQHCKKLRNLELMHNNICYGSGMFYGLTSLLSLTIDGCFTEGTFTDLHGLEMIEIDANRETNFNMFHHLSSLKYIGIRGLMDFRNLTFQDLINLKIKTICVDSPLADLEPGVFVPLEYLDKLSMINTRVGLRKTLASLYGLVGRNMTELQISRVSYHGIIRGADETEDRILSRDSIKYLKDICVQRLTLPANDILFIDLVTLEKSLLGSCLTHLDISENILHVAIDSFLFLHFLTNLKSLDTSEQAKVPSTFGLSITCSSNKPVENKGLEMKVNTVLSSKENGLIIYLPPLLNFANFSGITADLGTLGNPTFRNASNLMSLDLSYNGIPKAEGVFGLENLTYLDLSGNTGIRLSDTFFDALPSLRTLKLNAGSLLQDVIHLQVKRFLKSLPNLISFSISDNRLVELPKNMFLSNPLLQYLDLSKNIFISVPFDTGLPNQLHLLDMTSNSIGSLDSHSRSMLDEHYELTNHRFQIHLKGNFLSCSCGNFPFLFWLQETILFDIQNKNFSCLTQSGSITYTSVINHNSIQLWRQCTGEILLFVSCLLLSMILCSLSVALLIATNYTKLANLIINVMKYEISKPKREDFRRDVYVSYAEADYQWVCHELCPALEKRNLTLYIWDRDSVPGDSVPDQIAENIPQCWKIIIYFTDNYETDPWSYMSMMAAINCVDNLNPERLLLLLPEDAQPRIPDCLLEVVPESCILHVAVERIENDQLWNDIGRMIRTDP